MYDPGNKEKIIAYNEIPAYQFVPWHTIYSIGKLPFNNLVGGICAFLHHKKSEIQRAYYFIITHYHFDTAVHHDRLYHRFYTVSGYTVITVEEIYIFTFRLLYTSVPCTRYPFVAFLFEDTKSQISFIFIYKSFDYVYRVVCTTIINKQHLNIPVGLARNRVQTSLDIRGYVKTWNYYRN